MEHGNLAGTKQDSSNVPVKYVTTIVPDENRGYCEGNGSFMLDNMDSERQR